MVDEVLAVLNLKPGMCAVDGTVGHAGHSRLIAQGIGPGGHLLGLDWDESMLAVAKDKLHTVESVSVRLMRSDYRGLPECLREAAAEWGIAPEADAILLDLGLNNAQIEDPERGISFMRGGPLDMRMDRTKGEPASAWLNRATPWQIEDVIFRLGGERWARKIAQVIVERRRQKPLTRTDDLVDCVLAAIPAAKRDKRLHPATRTFQAVRIHINGELESLDQAVADIADCLALDGVMAVLSYHSGEDAEVKKAFRAKESEGGFEQVFRKPERPGEEEVARNPKARSARLRALRRSTEADR